MPFTLLRRGMALLLCCLLCAGWPGLAGRVGQARAASFFGSFGIQDEIELGRRFDVLVRSRLPLVEDPEIKLYIRDLVERLATAIPPQPFSFTSHVLLHPSMNAFAVPGGYVFIHTGLIAQFDHESELAGVIAHELAHVTQRHVASRMDRAKLTTLASLVGALAGVFLGGAGGGALLGGSVAAGQATMLNYSRVDENEADQQGLQYLTGAGFRPQGMQTAFEKIRKRQWISGVNIPEYLSTHPDVGSRVNEMAARIKTMPLAIQNRPDNDARFQRVKTLVLAKFSDPEAAERVFASAPAKNCLAQMGLGILASRRNRINEASKAFDRALACGPEDPLIWREAGTFYYKTGDSRSASMLERALRMDPDDVMAQFYYARLLSDAGRRNEAYQHFEQVLRRVPEDSEVHYHYGRSLGESGQNFKAYLHLAYSAMYENDRKKTESWLSKARAAAVSPADKKAITRFDGILEERKTYWKR